MADVAGNRLVGRTISHYRVLSSLGAGGMGVVYKGEDVRLGRPVAIKFVADDFANDAQAVARLRAEARAASALNHPNICTIYDIGTEEGRPFIVMELMEGQTLRDRLTRGRLKVHELVDLGIQIADALQGAHSAGIVHRDIKPANIFLTGRGHVKILDFGLAKLTTGHVGSESETLASPDLTAAGTTLGTVSYMSPEQAAGDELDGRTDLFSLGVVLYEAATGRQPFEGRAPAVILAAILNRSPALPGLLNPDLPTRLQEVITTCLEKDRELRYQSAADLRADLKRIRRDLESGRGHVGQTATVSLTDSAARPVAGWAGVPTGPSETRPGRRTPLLAGGAVVLATALAGGTYALWPADQPDPQAPVQTRSTPEEKVREQLALARASLAAGNFRAAQAYAAGVLSVTPNQAGALRIREEATSALTRFDEALALARQRLVLDDLSGAARALTTARDIDPGNAAVAEVAARIAERVRPAEKGSATLLDTPAAARRQAPTVSTARSAAAPARSVAPPSFVATPATTASAANTPPQAQQVPALIMPPTPTPPSAVSAPGPPPAETPPPALPAPSLARATPAPAAPQPDDARGAAAAAPRVSSAADDDAAVRRVVASYGRAIEAKDIGLFRTVKPNLSREEERRLRDGFRAVASQEVRLTVLSVDVRDQNATVVAQRRDLILAGGRRQAVETRQTFTLTRSPGGWVIADIR